MGAALALTVQSVVAVAAGHLLGLLPPRTVHIASAVLFLGSAIVMWMRKSEVEEGGATDEARTLPVVARVLAVVLVAERGDLTQVATAGLAARYREPLAIFTGATLALWCVVAIAVFVGHRAARVLDPEITKKIAAVIFAAVGVAFLAGWF